MVELAAGRQLRLSPLRRLRDRDVETSRRPVAGCAPEHAAPRPLSRMGGHLGHAHAQLGSCQREPGVRWR
jgi:hypothetical protein